MHGDEPERQQEGEVQAGRRNAELALHNLNVTLEQRVLDEVGIRPEYLSLNPPGGEGLPVRILKIDDIGRHKIARVALNGCQLNVIMTESTELTGDMGSLVIDPAHANIYIDEHLVEGSAP